MALRYVYQVSRNLSKNALLQTSNADATVSKDALAAARFGRTGSPQKCSSSTFISCNKHYRSNEGIRPLTATNAKKYRASWKDWTARPHLRGLSLSPCSRSRHNSFTDQEWDEEDVVDLSRLSRRSQLAISKRYNQQVYHLEDSVPSEFKDHTIDVFYRLSNKNKDKPLFAHSPQPQNSKRYNWRRARKAARYSRDDEYQDGYGEYGLARKFSKETVSVADASRRDYSTEAAPAVGKVRGRESWASCRRGKRSFNFLAHYATRGEDAASETPPSRVEENEVKLQDVEKEEPAAKVEYRRERRDEGFENRYSKNCFLKLRESKLREYDAKYHTRNVVLVVKPNDTEDVRSDKKAAVVVGGVPTPVFPGAYLGSMDMDAYEGVTDAWNTSRRPVEKKSKSGSKSEFGGGSARYYRVDRPAERRQLTAAAVEDSEPYKRIQQQKARYHESHTGMHPSSGNVRVDWDTFSSNNERVGAPIESYSETMRKLAERRSECGAIVYPKRVVELKTKRTTPLAAKASSYSAYDGLHHDTSKTPLSRMARRDVTYKTQHRVRGFRTCYTRQARKQGFCQENGYAVPLCGASFLGLSLRAAVTRESRRSYHYNWKKDYLKQPKPKKKKCNPHQVKKAKQPCKHWVMAKCDYRDRCICEEKYTYPRLKKRKAPYKSYSEHGYALEHPKCECPVDKRYLQPRCARLRNLRLLKAPPPEADIIDTRQTKACVYKYMGREDPGETRTCHTFYREYVEFDGLAKYRKIQEACSAPLRPERKRRPYKRAKNHYIKKSAERMGKCQTGRYECGSVHIPPSSGKKLKKNKKKKSPDYKCDKHRNIK